MAITADEMAKKRWKGVSKKERAEFAKKLAEARRASISPEQRSAIAKKAALARWGKKKKGK